jgi:hypothetical protein
MIAQFHLAFPVRSLEEARAFYVGVIGCTEGRSTWNHIDFNMYGHHVVAHLVPEGPAPAVPSEFDGREVPIPHFGLNLEWAAWEQLAERLVQHGARFRDPPHIRMKGRVGEHGSLFVFDPSGNALEFKAFRDPGQVFALDPEDANALRDRVTALIVREFGTVEEDLVASGILDSLRSMELMIALETEFAVKLSHIQVADLSTVTRIVASILDARGMAADAREVEGAP